MISIAVLIYKSTGMADLCYEQIMKYTPMIHNGGARFFFVANDATDKVKKHLKAKKYPHVIQNNKHRSDSELYKMGIAKPEYINRVYCGWNRAIEESDEWVVLLNSDNFVSEGWLEGLVKHRHENIFLCSGLVERKHPVHGVFPGALHAECGSTVDNYNERVFQKVAASQRKYRGGDELIPGGAYMPCMFKKQKAIDVGLYPKGNIAGSSFNHVAEYGDVCFVRKLRLAGVKHSTTWDSVVYHFKEGEMDE